MSEPATSFRPDILPAAQRRMWDARIGVPGYFVLYGGTALSPLPISRRARMEGRRSANVIAQGQRAQPREGLSGPFYAGTSAALGHAVAMGKPCKGAIELDARGGFALAGLYGSPAGTQGCAPTSLTLGYYIAGPSALHSFHF